MEEARRGGLSDASRVKAPPRGLLIEGSSSSEFVSAVEEPIATDDEIHANGAGEAVSPMPEGKEKRLPESESKGKNLLGPRNETFANSSPRFLGRAARRNQRRDALRKSYRDSGEEGPKTNGDAAVRGAVRAAEKAARKAAKKARREAAKEAATGFDPDARKRKRTVERNKRRNQNRKRWRESGGGGARRGEVA